MKNSFITLILLFLYSFTVNATNVTVGGIEQVPIDENNQRVTFSITWDDSWRKDSEEPDNYDGVWIFIKYRNCLEKASGNPGDYNHAYLSTTVTDHVISDATIDQGSGPASLALETEVGITNIDGTDRGMGIFLYQPAGLRVGDISAKVSILWKTDQHDPAEDPTVSSFDIQVVAIEMVYIPEGSFYVGDGISYYTFRNANDNNRPLQVTSAAPGLRAYTNNYSLYTDGSSGNPLNDNWPNGYSAFWIMKYEISQIQYMQFLNTLARSVQSSRINTNITPSTSTVASTYVMSNSAIMSNRNAIVCDPTIEVGGEPVEFHMDYDGDRTYDETVDGANIACNWLSGYDVLAYLDWAALRPMTEFEFEKAARGPHIRPFGYTYQKPWGIQDITEVTGITNPGLANEGASNTGIGLCVFNDNANVSGPMRCGFGATTTTTDRYSCGASYYGVFELGGNVYEPCMSFWNNVTRADDFEGESGDGKLSSTGNANEDTWPQDEDGNGRYYLYYRGGHWAQTTENYMTISARLNAEAYSRRYNYSGGRGVRYVSK